MQAHHIIPEEVWKKNQDFFDKIGLSGQMDKASNGILLPDRASAITNSTPQTIHFGSHPEYSGIIGEKVESIKYKYDTGVIDEVDARKQIAHLQDKWRSRLQSGDVPFVDKDGKKKLH